MLEDSDRWNANAAWGHHRWGESRKLSERDSEQFAQRRRLAIHGGHSWTEWDVSCNRDQYNAGGHVFANVVATVAIAPRANRSH